ncbi:MAG: pilus assembly protein PilP, partial [Coxiellaceae bacterium]|nr:pilus assembly protein PilP [Coxiellaceae bacterium]
AEMDKILKTITSIGHEAGLSFVRFKPELEKNQGFYAEIPIKIIALGNYHQMATFMSNVANLNDLFTIHDFKIKRDKPTEEVLTMHVSLRVYQQKFKVQLPIVPVAIPTVPKKQYQAQKQRDPFERPNTDQKKTSKQLYANAILTNVSVSSLKLIGTVSQNNRIWAMIATPQGNIVRITVGYRVGNNQALVTQITENQVKFKVDTDDKDKPRILTITMDEPS